VLVGEPTANCDEAAAVCSSSHLRLHRVAPDKGCDYARCTGRSEGVTAAHNAG
jgi:hypothetical protein